MYEITIRIQDKDSTDYECPLCVRVVDDFLARHLFNSILQEREWYDSSIRERYGIDLDDKDVWLQLFLTDSEQDYDDDEEYWMSYEVL